MEIPARRAALLVAVVSLLLAGSARSQEAVPDSVTAERVVQGSRMFNNGSCTICHAVVGSGPGPRAPDLSDPVWLHSEGDFAGIFQTVFWGVPREKKRIRAPWTLEMHPKGGMAIDFEQTKAIAAYVWTLSRSETFEYVAEQVAFVELAKAGRRDEAVAFYREAAGRWPDPPILEEPGINRLGYQVMARQGPEAAIAVFEIATELFPDSWNVWDSLAEAHMEAGHRERAVELYRRSLEMNPENQNAREKLGELGAG